MALKSPKHHAGQWRQYSAKYEGNYIAKKPSQQNSGQAPQQDPVFEFFRTVHIIEQLSRTRAESALPDEMKMAHFGVLSYLVHQGDGASPASIAEIFQVTRPSMTNTLQRLEARDYIRIAANPEDGRAKRVYLTSKGEKAFHKAREAIAPVFNDIFQALGEKVFLDSLPGLQEVANYLDKNR
ncbi:MarR family transcriptional regulator [Gilvimarinus sp. SDUM040013]|uniref:MarR family transcriptional regulator n=1 Tax=Gilvimarinus gilvus TaxID=3058038 RepID=A0ABU4S3C1_9GAMM|nr:MarR family transcriptional regulator [Gilvimarinus sp. SDUM040013]MDO3386231.1 MarR family transcriptional regulator [Gilvimarinus sp. SDUM040013]MDX6849774.1 MarR family transcriptional regulator [Gilvimarinus sp. SDUM040013]